MDPNFGAAISALSASAIPYWVSGGSLLGIVRDQQLLEWDHDIDVSVKKSEVDEFALVRLMREAGFELMYNSNMSVNLQFVREGGRKVDINLCEEIQRRGVTYLATVWRIESEASLPVRLLRRTLGEFYIRSLSSASLAKSRSLKFALARTAIAFSRLVMNFFDAATRIPSRGYFMREDSTFPLTSLHLDCMEFAVPRDAPAVLEQVYGSGWRTPVVSTCWTQFTRHKREL